VNSDEIFAHTWRHPSGCWLWQGAVTRDGYGRVRIAGVLTYVHRVAYAIAYGPLPARVEVSQLCSRPSCINPAHLCIRPEQFRPPVPA
jgi:hypothetical protein